MLCATTFEAGVSWYSWLTAFPSWISSFRCFTVTCLRYLTQCKKPAGTSIFLYTDYTECRSITYRWPIVNLNMLWSFTTGLQRRWLELVIRLRRRVHIAAYPLSFRELWRPWHMSSAYSSTSSKDLFSLHYIFQRRSICRILTFDLFPPSIKIGFFLLQKCVIPFDRWRNILLGCLVTRLLVVFPRRPLCLVLSHIVMEGLRPWLLH